MIIFAMTLFSLNTLAQKISLGSCTIREDDFVGEYKGEMLNGKPYGKGVTIYQNGNKYEITPVVYRQGSLGASGDLVPLAHLTLPLVGEGEVEMQGEVISGAEMLKRMNWKPISMASKEGLALLNGTQNMSAFAVWSLLEAERLSKWADAIAAMSLDAFDGRIDPFTPVVHAIRPHMGQIETAERFRKLLADSELIKGHKVHVQDPYSFRCVPQVHGAVKDTLRYVKSVIDIEINSATDGDKMYERNYFGMMMVETGEADAFITGLYTRYSNTLKVVNEVIGIQPEFKTPATMHIRRSIAGTPCGWPFLWDASRVVSARPEHLPDRSG